MKLTIRNHIFFYVVSNEDNIVVAKIKSKYFWGAVNLILDVSGNTIYTTNIVNLDTPFASWNCPESRRYVILNKESPIATAKFKYAENTNRGIAQRVMIRPPLVDEMKIQSIYGEFNIRLQKNKSLTIEKSGKVIGVISNFFAFKEHYISCDEIDDKAFLLGLYVLARYMVHEDDLLVV